MDRTETPSAGQGAKRRALLSLTLRAFADAARHGALLAIAAAIACLVAGVVGAVLLKPVVALVVWVWQSMPPR